MLSLPMSVAGTLFTGSSRVVFRSELAFDEATWVRGRGWGIWKALLKVDRRATLPGVSDPERIARELWQRRAIHSLDDAIDRFECQL